MRVRAVIVSGPGEPDVLTIGERALRDVGPDEIRVRVHAAGLNRADVLQRRGLYPAPVGAPPDVLGLEYAGVVEARGHRVTEHEMGARVMGITSGGAMAEAVVVHAREAMPVPSGIDTTAAAAIPEAFLTAWDALFRQSELRAGSTLLVHAAASGVGTAAIQLAGWAGARVIGTSRSQSKLARLDVLGLRLDRGIVVGKEPSFAKLVEETAPGGADVILDGVGAAYLGENLRALAPRGTLVVIGLLAGATAELPLSMLLQKRASIVGTVLRSRPLEEKIELARSFSAHSHHAFATGALRPVVAEVLPMSDIADAHRRLEANTTVGKLVLKW